MQESDQLHPACPPSPPSLPRTVTVLCGRCPLWLAEGSPGSVTVAHLEITETSARLYRTRAHREIHDNGLTVREHTPTDALATSGRTPVALYCPACGALGTVSARALATRWRADPWCLYLTWP